jgi:hypothetical protein
MITNANKRIIPEISWAIPTEKCKVSDQYISFFEAGFEPSLLKTKILYWIVSEPESTAVRILKAKREM